MIPSARDLWPDATRTLSMYLWSSLLLGLMAVVLESAAVEREAIYHGRPSLLGHQLVARLVLHRGEAKVGRVGPDHFGQGFGMGPVAQ